MHTTTVSNGKRQANGKGARTGTRRTVYDVITDRIVGMLEAGAVPWRRPWHQTGPPRNLASGKHYRGVNVFMLSAASYSSPYWLTYRQAQERGGNVRKGEKGYPAVYWHWFDEHKESDGLFTKRGRPKSAKCMVRYYTVFNVGQCDGIEYPQPERRQIDPIPECERIVASMPNSPPIVHGGDRAYYQPSADSVQMPERGQFHDAPAYYGVLFHELSHATGHPSRCDRKHNLEEWTPFGSADYSREELVAEMGSAFLSAEAGISPPTIDNSAAYIAGWWRRLRGDNRCVVHAAAQAQKAADYILGKPAVDRKAVA